MEDKAPPARPEAPPPTKITAEIKGYRQLSPTEQALMNEAKDEGEVVRDLLERVSLTLPEDNPADGRAIALAKTKFQEGFMWLCRAIAKPTTFAVALIALFALSCNASGQPVAVASTAVYDAGDPPARPRALFRWDGNTLVLWAQAGAVAEVFLPAPTWLPIVGPFFVEAGQAYVRVEDPPFEWKGSATGPLPAQALGAFRPSEIVAWSLAPAPPG